MAEKSKVQVVIGGKVLTLGGYEDELHFQKIASYINHVIDDLKPTDVYRNLSADLKSVMIEINLADELAKAKDNIEQLEADLRQREDDLSELRQELVELKLELEKSKDKENNDSIEENVTSNSTVVNKWPVGR